MTVPAKSHVGRASDTAVPDVLASLRAELDEALQARQRAEERCASEVHRRRDLEEQLVQAQKMEGLGRLAGGVAHDFNNLLTAILGYAEMLTSQIGPGLPLYDDLHRIQSAAERASRLTRQLLVFSRRQRMKMDVLDLGVVVKDTHQLLRRLIGEDIEIVYTPPEMPCRVRADGTQLEQIVINLAVNARDAMPDGGTLTIEVERVGSHVELRVSDTGVGMPPELVRKIFDPFFTTKDPDRGTGLGLATARGIVDHHRGSIAVDSVQDEGTTFVVRLPVARTSAPLPVTSDARPSVPVGKETVLLVEDDDAVRHLVANLLGRHGYRVLEAARPDDAITIFERHDAPIALVLSDIVMPGMTGTDMAKRMLEQGPIRVLFMSGYTRGHDQVAELGRGGLPIIDKPFGPSELLARVRQAIEQPKVVA